MPQPITDERFARLFQALEGYEARQAANKLQVADSVEVDLLVSIERAHEIRQFHIALCELQHKYGLRLQCLEEGEPLAIIDARRDMPQGYLWTGLIRADGGLEITEWVPED
jgi:hypothetical protein